MVSLVAEEEMTGVVEMGALKDHRVEVAVVLRLLA